MHIQVPLTENHNHLKSQAAALCWQEARESHPPSLEPACSIPSQMVHAVPLHTSSGISKPDEIVLLPAMAWYSATISIRILALCVILSISGTAWILFHVSTFDLI